MFIHDTIKINYIHAGYLPNFPYHLVTDDEMFNAFLGEDGYFADNYPCVNEDLSAQYAQLKLAISYHIEEFRTNGTDIPSWVYSYMLGSAISVNSDEQEIDNLITLLNLEVPSSSEFTPELAQQCYDVSKEWIKKLPNKYVNRPATMFGEPHVIKSLRLQEVNVLQ